MLFELMLNVFQLNILILKLKPDSSFVSMVPFLFNDSYSIF